MVKTIGNPGSWAVGAVGGVAGGIGRLAGHLGGRPHECAPELRTLAFADLRAALRAGFEDFGAFRTDVIFSCLVYPVIGVVLAWFAFDRQLLPLVFPLIAGFTLLGPLAALGLYEMSRRREAGRETGWADGVAVLQSPSLVPMLALGVLLLALFIVWLVAANLVYLATLGPEPPEALASFAADVLTTSAGWTMIVFGMGVGLLFAIVALAVSVVSFPLLLDRDVGLPVAVVTSVRVTRRNPAMVALWGLIVGVALAVASIPVLLGLIVVLPVLGHATWHLYRRAVVA